MDRTLAPRRARCCRKLLPIVTARRTTSGVRDAFVRKREAVDEGVQERVRELDLAVLAELPERRRPELGDQRLGDGLDGRLAGHGAVLHVGHLAEVGPRA